MMMHHTMGCATHADSMASRGAPQFYDVENCNMTVVSMDGTHHNRMCHQRGLCVDSIVFSVDARNRDKNLYPSPGAFEIVLPAPVHDVCSIELLNIVLPLKSDLADPYLVLRSRRLMGGTSFMYMANQTSNELHEGGGCADVLLVFHPARLLTVAGQLYMLWERDLCGTRAIKRFHAPGCRLDRFDVAIETYLDGPEGPLPRHSYPLNPTDTVHMTWEIVALRP